MGQSINASVLASFEAPRKTVFPHPREVWWGHVIPFGSWNMNKNKKDIRASTLCITTEIMEVHVDGGAWWAAIYRVAQSWTWPKRLSSSSMLTKPEPLSNYNGQSPQPSYSEKEKHMGRVTKEIDSDCVMPLRLWNCLYHDFMLP